MQCIEKKIAVNLSGLHPKKYHQLITQFGCDGAIIGQSEAFYTALNLPQQVQKRLQHPNIEAITKTQRWAKLNHVHIIDAHHQYYPQHLKQLPCWPPLLYVQGNMQKLTQGNIAVVGSRNASFYGLEATKTFTQYLAKSGWIITSGLAIGVDKTAHQAALSCQQSTIAVIGLGLDQITPKQNKRLSEKIIDTGCIITEMPPGTPYQPDCFPRRNRIISALSTGILITEARQKSGSMITAQYSIDLHKPVMAIPGRITQPQAMGCLQLIQDGAFMVTKPEHCQEILQSYDPIHTQDN